MNEIFSEVITTGGNPPGANQIVQKDVFPIAIKISSLSLTERFFRFQEIEKIPLWVLLLAPVRNKIKNMASTLTGL